MEESMPKVGDLVMVRFLSHWNDSGPVYFWSLARVDLITGYDDGFLLDCRILKSGAVVYKAWPDDPYVSPSLQPIDATIRLPTEDDLLEFFNG